MKFKVCPLTTLFIISALKCLWTTGPSLQMLLSCVFYYYKCFWHIRPRETHNSVFHSVVCHWNFQERVREWGRKSANVMKWSVLKTHICVESRNTVYNFVLNDFFQRFPSFLFLFLRLYTCLSKVVLTVRTVECVDFNPSLSKIFYTSNSFTVMRFILFKSRNRTVTCY